MSGSWSFTKFWTALLAIAIILAFLIMFWVEIKLIGQLIVAYLFVLALPDSNMTLVINRETLRALAVVGVNLVVLIFGYLIVSFWVSQFALPVRSWSERRKAFKSLLRYTWQRSSHGPAIFVKEGKPKADNDELNDLHAGVAFVDLNSAIVLEQQLSSKDAVREEVYFESQSEEATERKSYKPGFWKRRLQPFWRNRIKANITIVKTFGPGVVFTESGEKIVGWADLRKQARTRKEVRACTRDGIEVVTNISTVFTLGKVEETLRVTKVGNDWLVIKTAAVTMDDLHNNPGLQASDLVVKELLSDQLREEDIGELNRVYNQAETSWLENSLQGDRQKSSSAPQFIFDEERVFAAVYSRARRAMDGVLGEWTDLPVDVAAEVFRGLLAHETYDDLYLPEDPKNFPLADFKEKFVRIVRNVGILGYQIVMRKDDSSIKIGQVWNEDELIFSAPMRFQSPAVLRDRGIKVLSAGFSDLMPVNEVVRAQLLENWQAHWQKETQKTLADHELRAARIHNHERSRTQQDMIYSLSRIFRESNFTDEALAIRLYQALEVAATHPATQRLLPADTVEMLSNLRQWLLSDTKRVNDSDDLAMSVENPK